MVLTVRIQATVPSEGGIFFMNPASIAANASLLPVSPVRSVTGRRQPPLRDESRRRLSPRQMCNSNRQKQVSPLPPDLLKFDSIPRVVHSYSFNARSLFGPFPITVQSLSVLPTADAFALRRLLGVRCK